LLIASREALSQSCSGQLGKNIFKNGDFGEGAATVLSKDPKLAPGYIYTTNVPMDDGYYTITNNMANWPFLWAGWQGIQDNSNSPNGYMMVVNASFQSGLFYIDTVYDLCENTTYEFSIDVFNLMDKSYPNYIKPNLQFLINGVSKYSTGNVPNNEKWNRYSFTFSTLPGQDSLILSLRNNAPGGAGNDLALDNISFRPCGPKAFINPRAPYVICPRSFKPRTLIASLQGNRYNTPNYQWQINDGNGWTNISGANQDRYIHSNGNVGFYKYRYLLANTQSNLLNENCRVLSEENFIEIKKPILSFIDSLICREDSIFFGNRNISTPGIYSDSFVSKNGCDSIVFLTLSKRPIKFGFFDSLICPNDFIVFNNKKINAEGIYLDTLLGSHGCDSVVRMNLIHRKNKTSYIDTFVCKGKKILFNGTYIDKEGLYRDTFSDLHGCDSFLVLKLTFKESPLALDIKSSNPLCTGDTSGSIQLLNERGAILPILFAIGNDKLDTIRRFQFLAKGLYKIRAMDNVACTWDTSIELFDPPQFEIDIQPKFSSIELGEFVRLSTTANDSIARYNWKPEGLLNCDINCSPITVYPFQSLWIKLLAESDKGCFAKDSSFVEIKVKQHVFIPNAFSPGNDQLNNVFRPSLRSHQIKEVESFIVFNRYGQILHQILHADPRIVEIGWSGENAPLGVYGYLLRIRFLNGDQKLYSGNVHLLR